MNNNGALPFLVSSSGLLCSTEVAPGNNPEASRTVCTVQSQLDVDYKKTQQTNVTKQSTVYRAATTIHLHLWINKDADRLRGTTGNRTPTGQTEQTTANKTVLITATEANTRAGVSPSSMALSSSVTLTS